MSKDLHDKIMNLPCERTMSHFATQNEMRSYKEGHRDARHAAAELALSYTAGAAKGGNTSDNSNFFAANKAAEEGELPALMELRDRIAEMRETSYTISQYPETAQVVFDSVTEALDEIAADRASRQVANKAEVEPAVGVPAMQNAFMTLESNGGEGRNIVLKFNKREDAYAVHDFLLKAGGTLYATPPATTGASTAPANANPVSERELKELRKMVAHAGVAGADELDSESAMACFWSLIGQINKQLESRPVGASTVLTDERIGQLWLKVFRIDHATNRQIAFAREVEREVAAQAGQVVVPEEMSDDDTACWVELQGAQIAWANDDDMHHIIKMTPPVLRALIESVFTPSPAKESK